MCFKYRQLEETGGRCDTSVEVLQTIGREGEDTRIKYRCKSTDTPCNVGSNSTKVPKPPQGFIELIYSLTVREKTPSHF